MLKRQFFFAFALTLCLSVLILILSTFGFLSGASSFFQKGVSFLGAGTYRFFQGFPLVSQSKNSKKLGEENQNLAKKIIDQQKLERENAALLDQFQTASPKSYGLLPSNVVGAPGFIPGLSVPFNLIIDKGSKDNVKVGMGVVVGNNLVGKIVQTSFFLSKVSLVTDPSLSLSSKTTSNAAGVIKGVEGGKMVLDNVILSESLKNGDFVLTNGDINLDGVGLPPDIIIGKIISIEKNPSALFQKAKVESLLNFTKLSKVFVVMGYK